MHLHRPISVNFSPEIDTPAFNADEHLDGRGCGAGNGLTERLQWYLSSVYGSQHLGIIFAGIVQAMDGIGRRRVNIQWLGAVWIYFGDGLRRP